MFDFNLIYKYLNMSTAHKSAIAASYYLYTISHLTNRKKSLIKLLSRLHWKDTNFVLIHDWFGEEMFCIADPSTDIFILYLYSSVSPKLFQDICFNSTCTSKVLTKQHVFW